MSLNTVYKIVNAESMIVIAEEIGQKRLDQVRLLFINQHCRRSVFFSSVFFSGLSLDSDFGSIYRSFIIALLFFMWTY